MSPDLPSLRNSTIYLYELNLISSILKMKKRYFFGLLQDVLLFYTRSSLRQQKQKTILSLHEKNENYVERHKKYTKRVKHQKSATF